MCGQDLQRIAGLRDDDATVDERVRRRTATPAAVAELLCSALVKHEDGHKAIGTNAADYIRDAGFKLPPEPLCSELARSVDKMTSEILERYRQREREYDRDTDHGRTQGARFP